MIDGLPFRTLLLLGYMRLGIVDKDVAREFGVSLSTVRRWKSGKNAPHPAMRKPVFVWLEQLSKERTA